MVSCEPLILDTIRPPIIAVIIPADGGKPEATDIPRQSGKAIRKTRKPDVKSLRQFSCRPAMPVLGVAVGADLLIIALIIVILASV